MTDPTQPGWNLRFPWLVALLCSLVPVVFAIASSVVVQVLELTGVPAHLVLTGGTVLSALVGLLVMARARPSLAEFGWRTPRHVKHALWFVPILLAEAALLATGDVAGPWVAFLAGLLFAVAVGLNEELWFRGLVLQALRTRGAGAAVVGSAVLFAVVHAAGMLGGADPVLTAFQIAFALVFGLVTALLVLRTGSLWPGIVWHIVHNTISFAGPDVPTPAGMVAYGVVSVALLGYAAWLARRP